MVLSLIKNVDNIYFQKLEQLNKCVAKKWLDSQPAIAALAKRRYSKNTKRAEPSPEEWREIRATRLLSECNDLTIEEVQRWRREDSWWMNHLPSRDTVEKYVTSHNTAEAKRERFARRIVDYVGKEPFAWWRGIFVALQDYYYSDRWEKLYSEYHIKERDLKAARAAILTLQSLSKHLIEPVRMPLLEKKIEAIEHQLASGVASLYPVRRKDETTRERVLVYDLYDNNIAHRKGKRVSLIHSLMTIEGIERSLDLKTLERLVSDWHSARRQYRQKSRAFEERSAGVKRSM